MSLKEEIRDYSEDNCTCFSCFRLKAQVMAFSILIFAAFIIHIVHMFWIDANEDFSDLYHMVYLLLLLPNFIALVLYVVYFGYYFNCCGAVGCCD